MKKLGKNKANVAIAHSLPTVVYAILKEGRPYQAPDPKHMHELERAKLIRHHSKRLRDLGPMKNLSARWSPSLPLNRRCDRNGCANATHPQDLKVCRGALGFRARQTRPQVYSVVKERAAGAPSQGRPKPKRAKPTKSKKLKTE